MVSSERVIGWQALDVAWVVELALALEVDGGGVVLLEALQAPATWSGGVDLPVGADHAAVSLGRVAAAQAKVEVVKHERSVVWP